MEPVLIGVSLKMYFGYQQTLKWCEQVSGIASRHPVVLDGSVRLFVLPSFPAIQPVLNIFRDTSVSVGAQDLFWEDRGAYTGEVSGGLLAEMGCTYAEVGHAERRRLFGEDDRIIARKAVAALRNGLTPILCLGEKVRTSPEQAAASCIGELDPILRAAAVQQEQVALVVAYEPQWAIGASEPASTQHIAEVCSAISGRLRSDEFSSGSRVIYGGSAGPGLLSQLDGSVDGLFLGRFAHDPDAVAAVLNETLR